MDNYHVMNPKLKLNEDGFSDKAPLSIYNDYWEFTKKYRQCSCH